jgi:hypothetical protein
VTLDGLYSKIKIDENQVQQWYGRSNGWGDWNGQFGAPGDIYQPGSYTLAGHTVTGASLNNFPRSPMSLASIPRTRRCSSLASTRNMTMAPGR